MNENVAKSAAAVLLKADPASPALIVTGRETIAIKAGTTFNGRTFAEVTPVPSPEGGFVAGTDYAVVVDGKSLMAVKITAPPSGDIFLGGFHFAPGGNAPARSGGDDIPAINPFSAWDRNFRFAGPDPRGMVYADVPLIGPGWFDIYMLGRDHLTNGTSKFGVTIADGNDPPQNPAGGYYRKLDFATADAVAKHHGKRLLNYDEFRFLARGGTEKTACGNDPKITGLDAPRTSWCGLMQPFGNLYQWGTDGDPDHERASLFGGSWRNDGDAGSRCAYVAFNWPDYSDDGIGARGRGDHLQLV